MSTELYRPSNATEGDFFERRWCQQCRREPYDLHDKDCDILLMVHAFDTDDEEYPKAWVYDEDGKPKCTAFINKHSDEPEPYRCGRTSDLFQLEETV